jgi:hypothetical protein
MWGILNQRIAHRHVQPALLAARCACMQDSVDKQRADGLWNHVYNDSKPLARPRWHQKRCFQGGFGDFLSSTSATRLLMTRGRSGNNDNDKRPPLQKGARQRLSPLRSSLHLVRLGVGGRFPPIHSPSYCLQITKKHLNQRHIHHHVQPALLAARCACMQDSVDKQRADELWNHVYNDSKPLAQPRWHQKRCIHHFPLPSLQKCQRVCPLGR